MSDDLQHFVDAQGRVIDHVRQELKGGRKMSHWMWFIFPQISGLGRSATAKRFAIADLQEARAYLAHPILGPRLIECTRAVLHHKDRTLFEIFDSPDDLKFASSMTLFAHASDEPVFRAALAQFCDGQEDQQTLKRL